MASGKLGSVDLAAEIYTLIYTVPAGKSSTVNIRFANRNPGVARIRLAIGSGASPAPEDYVTYDSVLPANGIIEDTGLVMSGGEKLWAYSNAANVSVRAHGFEE